MIKKNELLRQWMQSHGKRASEKLLERTFRELRRKETWVMKAIIYEIFIDFDGQGLETDLCYRWKLRTQWVSICSETHFDQKYNCERSLKSFANKFCMRYEKIEIVEVSNYELIV